MDAKTMTAIQADLLRAVGLSQRIAKKAAELATLTAKLDALTAKIESETRPLTLAAVESVIPPRVDVNAEIQARMEAGKAARRAELRASRQPTPDVLPSSELGRLGRQHDRNN